MNEANKRISKLISYWLRHNPSDAGLNVDESGWASIKQLLEALKSQTFELSVSDLIQLNEGFDKVRWEINSETGKIRATHGHSFPILLDDKQQTPPETLYHGTSIDSVRQIAINGLKRMQRNFVHLSGTIETAVEVAKRHGKPFIIEVDSERLSKKGCGFYKTGEGVWLTNDIPVEYLKFQPWYPVFQDNGYHLKELKREIGDRSSHFLYPHLDNLKLIWNTNASDDNLFEDQLTGKCYMIHLTYTRREQEIEGYPHIDVYENLDEWISQSLWIDQQYFYDLK
jgi:RNA:NAD 2'-phosphotransferase (TPT1/KptA family)